MPVPALPLSSRPMASVHIPFAFALLCCLCCSCPPLAFHSHGGFPFLGHHSGSSTPLSPVMSEGRYLPKAGDFIHSANAPAAFWAHTLHWATFMILRHQTPGRLPVAKTWLRPQSVDEFTGPGMVALSPLHRLWVQGMDKALRAAAPAPSRLPSLHHPLSALFPTPTLAPCQP